MKRRIFGTLLATLFAVVSMAQISNTLSPYSQFGLGTLSDQSQGFNRGMNGLGIGLRDSRQVNILNPASYSAVDSLTMVIDAGVSGQFTSFKENGKRVNAKTADIDYVIATFRVLRKLGASIGIVPYSNIGYNYYESKWIGEDHIIGKTTNSDNYYSNNYKGSGGFNQAFLGLGYELFKGVSIGANISYMWGNYSKTVSTVFKDSYINTLTKTYSAEVNTWKLDLGAQWTTKLSPSNRLTIGAVATIGHKLGADANLSIVNKNNSTGLSTTTTDSVANGLSIPYSFGGGVSLIHNNSLTIGADYVMQKWGDLEYPVVNEQTYQYKATRDYYKDRHKVTLGFDWLPAGNQQARSLLKRMHYRLGASYATPYYKIGNQDGPREISVSAGFSIPLSNFQQVTQLNISGQWVNNTAKGFVTENTFRINIGITFNQRWFAKWKVD